VVHDPVGTILQVNHAAASLLGIKAGAEKLTMLPQYMPQDQFPLWRDHMRRCTASLRDSTELTLRLCTGKSIPVELVTTAVPRLLGRPPAEFRTLITDITERRATEAALAQSQRDYRQLIDTVEGIVWEAEAESLQVNFVNRYAERLLGYPASNWSRPRFWLDRIYFEDRERVANQVARTIAKRQQLRIDYRVLTADRRLLWLHDSLTLVERGGRLKLLGVAVDITEKQAAEQSLRDAHEQMEERVQERTGQLRQSLADLEAFSYSLSHDLRSPLRAMQGFASLLESMLGEKLGSEPLDYLHRIRSSAERLDTLVQDVLNFSRVARAPITLQPVALDELVESLLHDFPAPEDRPAEIQVEHPMLPVYGHEAFVGQALSNLLTNAIKFMPPDRSARVRVWSEETRRNGGGGPGEAWVRIYVADNGVGIAPEDQTRIFRIFERVHPSEKYEGTGIGLAIVQKAVERMGGRVGVKSTPGEGSRFWIELHRPPH
jgi:PAS domain S-box-containing protein